MNKLITVGHDDLPADADDRVIATTKNMTNARLTDNDQLNAPALLKIVAI